MNATPLLPGLESLVKPFTFPASPYEYKVTALRECPTPENLQHCETPDKAADYWRLHIATHPHFNPDCECLAVLLLNTRKRVKGHQILSIGTMDTILAHPLEIFRLAIVTAASGLIVMHNLCAATHKLCYVQRRVMWRKHLKWPGTAVMVGLPSGCTSHNYSPASHAINLSSACHEPLRFAFLGISFSAASRVLRFISRSIST